MDARGLSGTRATAVEAVIGQKGFRPRNAGHAKWP